MKTWHRVLAGAVLTFAAASPLIHAVYLTEKKVSGQKAQLQAHVPQGTTELMMFFSVDQTDGACFATAAIQLATNGAPRSVAQHYAGHLGEGPHKHAAWFSDRKAVLKDLTTGHEKFLSSADIEALPFAGRFLLNVHAFLPEGARRVVVYSGEAVQDNWEPRCW